MEIVIDRTVRRDIGGDHQRIEYRDTLYRDEEYKGVLFPIYRAEFRWKGEDYIYLINGQSGRVVGERPYSIIKIATLLLTISLIVLSIYIYSNR